jgi:hypothetical protein
MCATPEIIAGERARLTGVPDDVVFDVVVVLPAPAPAAPKPVPGNPPLLVTTGVCLVGAF